MSEVSKEFLTSQISMNQTFEKELLPKINDENQTELEKPVDKAEQNIEQPVEEKVEKEDLTEISKQDENTNETENLEEDKTVKPIVDPITIVDGLENEPIELAKSFQNDVSIINDLKPDNSNLNEIIQSTLSRDEELCNKY